MPGCDQDNPACSYCPDEDPPDNQWSTAQKEVFANFVESPGGKVGMDPTYQMMKELRASVKFQNTPQNLGVPWDDIGWVTGTSAEYEALFEAVMADNGMLAGSQQVHAGRPVSPSSLLPGDQSMTRPVTPSGTPNDTPHARYGTEPINPASGEFYLEETDLAFPGFGIAYQHRRSYRSRIDYDGPMGHGWDHLYNQRLIYTANAPVDSLLPVVDVTELSENPAAGSGSQPPELVRPLTIPLPPTTADPSCDSPPGRAPASCSGRSPGSPMRSSTLPTI